MTQLIAKKKGLVLAIALMVVIPGVAFVRNGAAEGSTSTSTSTNTIEQNGSTSTGGTSSSSSENTVKVEQEAENLRQTVTDKLQSVKEETNQRVEAAKTRLQDAQLKRCEAQQKAITNIMGHIADRGQNQLDLFTTIATRVENFYTEKGKTLSNYDSLVADVNAKKAAALTVVSNVKNADTTFNCSGDDPHGVISGFKTSLQQEISALKEYRTSIKNLIVGVKSVQSTETSNTTTGGTQQ